MNILCDQICKRKRKQCFKASILQYSFNIVYLQVVTRLGGLWQKYMCDSQERTAPKGEHVHAQLIVW